MLLFLLFRQEPKRRRKKKLNITLFSCLHLRLLFQSWRANWRGFAFGFGERTDAHGFTSASSRLFSYYYSRAMRSSVVLGMYARQHVNWATYALETPICLPLPYRGPLLRRIGVMRTLLRVFCSCANTNFRSALTVLIWPPSASAASNVMTENQCPKIVIVLTCLLIERRSSCII